jgi:hypothetical protein
MHAKHDEASEGPGRSSRPNHTPGSDETGPSHPLEDREFSNITEDEIRKFDALLTKLAQLGHRQPGTSTPNTDEDDMAQLQHVYGRLQALGNELAMRSDMLFAKLSWELTWRKMSRRDGRDKAVGD